VFGLDDLAGASLFASGASLLGGFFSNNSSKKAAQAQMAFQERMDNTKYQRAVKDLDAAGLNPMLAYGNGVGGAPSGASYTAQNPVPGAVSSALDAAQVAKIKADTAVSTAQAAKTAADVPKSETKGKIWKKIDELISPGISSAKHGKMSDKAVDSLKELYPDEFPDDRSPLHKVIDRIGEWNPYGLGL